MSTNAPGLEGNIPFKVFSSKPCDCLKQELQTSDQVPNRHNGHCMTACHNATSSHSGMLDPGAVHIRWMCDCVQITSKGCMSPRGEGRHMSMRKMSNFDSNMPNTLLLLQQQSRQPAGPAHVQEGLWAHQWEFLHGGLARWGVRRGLWP